MRQVCLPDATVFFAGLERGIRFRGDGCWSLRAIAFRPCVCLTPVSLTLLLVSVSSAIPLVNVLMLVFA